MIFSRIKQFQKQIKNPTLIKKSENLIYLTGQHFISGFLLVTPKKVVFFGDGLEKPEGLKTDYLKNFGKHTRAKSTVEIEDELTLSDLQILKKIAPKIKFQHVSSPLAHLRKIKTQEELKALKAVIKLTHEVFSNVKIALSQESWTEKQMARFIRHEGIGMRADDVSFAPIVAAGPNSAVPHHKPTDRQIKKNEPIVLDFGFKLNHYCSDFTRTVFIKSAPKSFIKIYQSVEKAYEEAFSKIQSHITGKNADEFARNHLSKEKLSKYFIHSLGHGTGLEVHEHPRVGPFSVDVLENGMVFSIEPGVYMKGKGGVRIEDLVYLENGKVKQFAECSRSLASNIIK